MPELDPNWEKVAGGMTDTDYNIDENWPPREWEMKTIRVEVSLDGMLWWQTHTMKRVEWESLPLEAQRFVFDFLVTRIDERIKGDEVD